MGIPEREDEKNLGSTFKALPVFQTLTTNLALFSSFARRSVLEPANYSGEDLEFVGVEPGDNQLRVHNGAITTILVALATQALSNYFEIKSIKPRLEDPDLEKFLDDLHDQAGLFRGMTKTRNAVFHVRSRRAWRDRDVVYLIGSGLIPSSPHSPHLFLQARRTLYLTGILCRSRLVPPTGKGS